MSKNIDEKQKEVSKKDVIYGIFIAIIIIACITLLILLAFEDQLPEGFSTALGWILPGFLFLGGAVLVSTYFFDEKNKKKVFLIGGIGVCIVAAVIIFLKLTRIIQT